MTSIVAAVSMMSTAVVRVNAVRRGAMRRGRLPAATVRQVAPLSCPVGVTFASLQALGPPAALEVARRAASLGYSSFWTAEVTGPEAFSLLGAVSQVAPELSLGTGVVALQ